MELYLNQYNKTIWRSKEDCEKDLFDSFNERVKYNEEISSKAVNICKMIHNEDYARAGTMIAQMSQVYEEALEDFCGTYYATSEDTETEISALVNHLDYTWGEKED